MFDFLLGFGVCLVLVIFVPEKITVLKNAIKKGLGMANDSIK